MIQGVLGYGPHQGSRYVRYVYPRSALGIPCKLEVAACLTVPVPGLGVEVSAT